MKISNYHSSRIFILISTLFFLADESLLAQNIDMQNKRLTDSLRAVLQTAINSFDTKSVQISASRFIDCLKDSLNKEDIFLVGKATNSRSDRGFAFFIDNKVIIDKIIENPGLVEYKLSGIIFKEEIAPVLQNKSILFNWKTESALLKSRYPSIGKSLIKNIKRTVGKNIEIFIETTLKSQNKEPVDWKKVNKEIGNKFTGFDYKMNLFNQQAMYYSKKAMWKECEDAAFLLLNKYGHQLEDDEINDIAWYYVFLNGMNNRTIKEATKRLKISIEKNPTAENLDTYANLLYKLNKTTEAFYWEKKAIATAVKEKDIQTYEENFSKMKKREKTWKDDTPVKSAL
jgi:hypothetical protein